MRLSFALVSASLLLAACAGSVWQAPSGRNHPLAGTIWDVRAGRFVEPDAVAQRLVGARFAVLGEKHDNPDHHRLQAWLLERMIAAGRRPAVAFEMFTTDQAGVIAQQLRKAPADADALAEAIQWRQSGWPDWAMYRPVIATALGAGLRIVAANLPRPTVQAAGRRGIEGLDGSFVARHALDRPPAPDVEAAMVAEIQDSHCGQAPASIVPRMVVIQRARDAQMADALLEVGPADGAVLIAGGGHARVDRGVPAHLRALDGSAAVVSVAFLEVRAGVTSPPAYEEPLGGDRLPFDYVWFTPAVDDEDPCVKHKESLDRLRPRR